MTQAFLSPTEAARALGTSPKALRLYEARGFLSPARTEAGWRVYGPEALARAREILALRRLGFSLAQIERLLAADPTGLAAALAEQEAKLSHDIQTLATQPKNLAALRHSAKGAPPDLAALRRQAGSPSAPAAQFPLPWPWDGQLFTLERLAPLTFLTGPLGSGKTRLAMALAEALAARFASLKRPLVQPTPKTEAALNWLVEDGAARSEALTLLAALLTEPTETPLVVDLVEHGLDGPSQQALGAYLRQKRIARPLIVMTRSTAILDPSDPPEAPILFCPANHAPPVLVPPWPGAPGFEAMASCLASPETRARVGPLKAATAL